MSKILLEHHGEIMNNMQYAQQPESLQQQCPLLDERVLSHDLVWDVRPAFKEDAS